jgi:hypothetical protein
MMMTGLSAELRKRWNPSWNEPKLARCFTLSLDFAQAARDRRAEYARRPDLSEQGVTMAVRKHLAGNHINTELKSYGEVIAQAEAGLKAAREGLGRPPRAADAVAEARRRELRDHLAKMSPAARISAALSDPGMAAAVLDAPSPAMVGIPQEALAQVRAAYARVTEPARLEALDQHEEAITLARAAFQTALVAVKSEVGLTDKQFAAWLDTGAEPELKLEA